MMKTININIPTETDLNQNQALERLRINPEADISEPPFYCKFDQATVMTAGNFTLINGKAKSGKTFSVVSMVAALISGKMMLGKICGYLPEDKKTVLYFDTEQSEFHATRTIKRICKMAEVKNPKNLIAYGLRPLTPAERLIAVEEKVYSTPGLGVVVIDGIRDLLTMGINDEAEATALTSRFLKWTAELDIAMILLLHQNKNDLNARGHIGTEVINKAETTITVTKDEKTGLFIVSCDYSRDLGFEDFAFTIQDGLPVEMGMPEEGQAKSRTPQSIKDEEHIEILNQVFSKSRKLNGIEFQEAIQYHFHVGVIRSRDFVYHYLIQGWCEKVREGKNVWYEYKRATF
jgi:hypothetical protein